MNKRILKEIKLIKNIIIEEGIGDLAKEELRAIGKIINF